MGFTACDEDENGELTWDEFLSFHHPDERVMAAEAKLRVEEFDKNKDSMLSYHEFAEIIQNLPGESNSTSEITDAFPFLDQDGNGHITVEEYIPWELGHFDRDKAITRLIEAGDANGNKELDADELMAIEKDIVHHHAEHVHIRELVEFSKMEVENEKEHAEHEKEHDKPKDEL